MKQGMGGRYITITLILALALFAGGFGANIIMAMSQKKNDNISPIEKVYVLDESGIGAIDWADTQLDKKQFPDVTFEESSAGIKELGLQMKDEEVKNVIVKLTKEKEQYTINLYIPNGSDIEKDDCDNLATAIKSVILHSFHLLHMKFFLHQFLIH